MTAQIQDQIHNAHPRVDFGALHLHGVSRGDERSNRGWGARYELTAKPDRPHAVRSSCWRGFQSCFRLEESGELVLDRYEYPDTGRPPTPVNERLTGDFFLVMKLHFKGRRTYVPFRAGRIVEDRAAWLFEPEDGWIFSTGEHRERPPVVVTPVAATGNVRCPACDVVFSVCAPEEWNGDRHRCGQSLVLLHGGQPLPADPLIHRARFDQVAVAAPDLTSGRAECPRCESYFLIRDRHFWDGERHTCGQQISLLLGGEVLPKDRALQEARLRPPFDLVRVEGRSQPILSRIVAPADGTTTSGSCPNCGLEGRLRVCDRRIVLCFPCYYRLPSRLWRE